MTKSKQSDKTTHIAELNDALRTTGIGGRIFVTAGINTLDQNVIDEIMSAVQAFDEFTADNDPFSEHDFGSVDVCDHKVFWKVDCYDKSMKYGSEDPSDPELTCRALTVMLAQEY